ncbi:MAG TPA: hypothetical protein K8W19_04610 [Victivallis vadensis]|nr:hypothetical protein [Victivallis vadensis]
MGDGSGSSLLIGLMGVESGIVDTGISAVHPMALADSARVSIREQSAVGSTVRAFPFCLETGAGAILQRTEIQFFIDIAGFIVQSIHHQNFSGRIFRFGKHSTAGSILVQEKVTVQPSAAEKPGSPIIRFGIRQARTFPELIHFLIAGNHELFRQIRSK